MADDVDSSESNISCIGKGQIHEALPGSESMACNKSDEVNVGDPGNSFEGKYRLTSIKARKRGWLPGSQKGHSTNEAE